MKRTNRFVRTACLLLAASLLLCVGAFAADEAMTGLANPWKEAASEEIAAETGLVLVLPEDAEAVCSYMEGLAQAVWTADGAEITERVSQADACPELGTDSLTAQSGVYFTGMDTQNKELTVGGRCPGYMEFQKGSCGAIIWYDEEAGAVYTVSMDVVSDPKQLGDLADLISPPDADAEAEGMIVIDGCAIAHDLTAVPTDEIENEGDFLWNITDGYGITYTDDEGVIWGICRIGEAGEFEIQVSCEEDPSPWTLGDQIWVGGSKLVELCVEDGVLTHILTDELVSGAAYDAQIIYTGTAGSSAEAPAV